MATNLTNSLNLKFSAGAVIGRRSETSARQGMYRSADGYSSTSSQAWTESDSFVSIGDPEPLQVALMHASAADPWVVAASVRLGELRTLLPNWNGGNEMPVHGSVVQRTFDLLDVLFDCSDVRQPWIVPLPDGGVQLDWSGDSGEVEVEVHATGVATAFAAIGDNEEEWSITATDGMQRLAELLGELD